MEVREEAAFIDGVSAVDDGRLIAAARAMHTVCDGEDRWQRMSSELRAKWIESVRPIASALALSRPTGDDANARDAWRYRNLRAAPVGVPGVPCIAIPVSATSGDYLSGEHADAAVDGFDIPVGDAVVAYVETLPDGRQGIVWADHPANTPGHVFTPLYYANPEVDHVSRIDSRNS